MKKTLLFLILLFITNIAISQINLKKNTYEVFALYKYNSININIDTAYLMNSKTFTLYNNIYIKYKNNDCYNKLTNISLIYDNRIAQQEIEYNMLKHMYDSLYSESYRYLVINQHHIDNLKTSISKKRKQVFIYSGCSLLIGIFIGKLL